MIVANTENIGHLGVQDKFKLIIRVRLVASISLLLVFAVVRLTGMLVFPFGLFAIAPLFEIFINQPYRGAKGKVKNPQVVFIINQVFDVLAITWGLHCIGGMDTFTGPLIYPMVFLFSSIILTSGITFFIANFSVIVFSGMLFLEKQGLLPVIHRPGVDLTRSELIVYLCIIFVAYNLIAFMASFLSRTLNKKQSELSERIKELNCFHELSKIVERHSDSVEEIMREMVGVLPISWKYPEVTCARIVMGQNVFSTENFKETLWRLSSDIKIHGEKCGKVDIYYLEDKPAAYEGPFSKEERVLLDSVAERLEKIVERIKAEYNLKEYSIRLKQSNKDLSNFSYIISHDLKEPLRNIDAFSRLIDNECAGKLGDENEGNLDRIRANVARMDHLIHNLLELSRIEKQKNTVEKVKAEDLVDEAVTRCEYSIKKSKAEVKINGKLPELFCDRVRVTEVFANLISNAVKFRGEDPLVIEIGCAEDMDFYEFYVRDNGQGVAKEDTDKIFEMFARCITGKGQKGTGIGLTIVKNIVEMSGGNVRVESVEGEGATFFFTVPVGKKP
ncbi:MAG: ATP-binding protein [Candidatus Tantalella remota]|nr:ATP-binding protein [Candidatus Tantalella remota]